MSNSPRSGFLPRAHNTIQKTLEAIDISRHLQTLISLSLTLWLAFITLILAVGSGLTFTTQLTNAFTEARNFRDLYTYSVYIWLETDFAGQVFVAVFLLTCFLLSYRALDREVTRLRRHLR